MRKDEIVRVTAILRQSFVENRKLKKFDLEELSNYLSLDKKSIEDIEVIRQEEMEHLNNKIKYFERVKNPRKIEEYKRILRNCEILFKVYFKNRMEEKVIPASLKEEKTTIQL